VTDPAGNISYSPVVIAGTAAICLLTWRLYGKPHEAPHNQTRAHLQAVNTTPARFVLSPSGKPASRLICHPHSPRPAQSIPATARPSCPTDINRTASRTTCRTPSRLLRPCPLRRPVRASLDGRHRRARPSLSRALALAPGPQGVSAVWEAWVAGAIVRYRRGGR